MTVHMGSTEKAGAVPNSTRQKRDGIVVWSGVTRALHWLQAIAVTAAAASGFLFFFRRALNITEPDAKFALISLHASIGYVVITILFGRIIWGFFGARNARWRKVLPAKLHFRQFFQEAWRVVTFKPERSYAALFLNRVMITAIFVMLVAMSVTGSFQAATNFYDWPFGFAVRNYIVADGVNPLTISARDEIGVDAAKLDQIKKVKRLSVKVHYFAANFLALLISTHIAGVVLMDVKRKGAIISPMFTGRRFSRNGDIALGRDTIGKSGEP